MRRANATLPTTVTPLSPGKHEREPASGYPSSPLAITPKASPSRRSPALPATRPIGLVNFSRVDYSQRMHRMKTYAVATGIALLAQGSIYADRTFFPIDSTLALTYQVYERIKGNEHKDDTTLESISNVKMISESRFLWKVSVDSAGIRESTFDTCSISDDQIRCQSSIYKIGINAVEAHTTTKLIRFDSKNHLRYDFEVSDTRTGSADRQIFQQGLGPIWLFQGSHSPIHERQIEKVLVSVNGKAIDGRRLVDSVIAASANNVVRTWISSKRNLRIEKSNKGNRGRNLLGKHFTRTGNQSEAFPVDAIPRLLEFRQGGGTH